MKLLLLGIGRWGANHLRVLHSLPIELYVSELDGKRLEAARKLGIPESHLHRLQEFAGQVDAAVIVTPAQSHFPLCREILEAGKDVFVEKPLTSRRRSPGNWPNWRTKRGASCKSATFSGSIRPRNGCVRRFGRANSGGSTSCADISADSNGRATTAASCSRTASILLICSTIYSTPPRERPGHPP